MKDVFHQKKRSAPWWRNLLIYAVIFAAVLAIFFAGTRSVARGSREEQLALAERAVGRAVVSCYAIEGFYPPDVAYMTEHYGLRYDAQLYLVHYEIFASNLMPDITVVERNP